MRRSSTLWCLAAAGLLAGAAPAQPVSGTLARPALASQHAIRSVLVGAARVDDRLVVVGERGHILYTDDGGERWLQARVPVSVTLTSACFGPDGTGWAVGHRGVVLKSTDRGQTWDLQLEGMALNRLLAGLAGHPELASAIRQFAAEGADKPLLKVACLDHQQVVAVGAFGLAVISRDGGRSWNVVGDLLVESGLKHVNSLVRHADSYILVGEQGQIFRANADWSHVQQLARPYKGSLFDVLALPGGDLLALGLRGNAFRSRNGGSTWSAEPLKASQTFTAGAVLSHGAVLLVDEAGGVWRASSERQGWQRESVTGTFPFAGLAQAADGRVLAVGARGIKWLERAATGS
ncbi:MAG: YCF48-related protein [Ramlibacter sp.]|nr:YCF48-related protein [Ramlibacter sp.]